MEQQIGSYKIVRELGRGAMGVVYQAFDPAIGRPIAIKVIRLNADMTREDSAQLRRRLIREASAAGKLSHPNLVTVYQLEEDSRDDPSGVFIAMEFVKGSGLRELMIRDGGISQSRCLEILRQIADGLDYAHRAGVVHRDIKPENILIREDGCVKIADFGIATIIESSTRHLTQTGMSLGTPSYMSPEQVKAERLDARSDQFSLAVVAFEMLTGRKPFVADSVVALMHQIIVADPLANRDARSRLPQSMLPAFQRALAKNAADRYPSSADFVKALTNELPAFYPSEITTPLIPGPATWSRVLLFVGFLCLVAILAGVGFWMVKQRVAVTTHSTARAAKTGSPLVSPSSPSQAACDFRAMETAYKSGDCVTVVKLGDQCLTRLPDDATVLNNMAICLLKTGEPRKAGDLLQHAIGLKPNDPYLYYNKACVAARMNEKDEVVNCLKKACQMGLAPANFRQDPDLAPLVGYRPFENLMVNKICQ